MRMELEQNFFAAARKVIPSETVPYAFEKRVMARLKSGAKMDEWAFWGKSLWRAAAPCIALAVLCGASFLLVEPYPSESAADLESALMAPIHAQTEAW